MRLFYRKKKKKVFKKAKVFTIFKCNQTMTGHTRGVWSYEMSECGSFIVSGSTDRTVRVWDVGSGRCLYNLQGHTSTVRCMALKENMLVVMKNFCSFICVRFITFGLI